MKQLTTNKMTVMVREICHLIKRMFCSLPVGAPVTTRIVEWKGLWRSALIVSLAAGMVFLQPAGALSHLARAASSPAFASAGTPIASVVGGNWSDPATWDLGRIPEAGDAIIINAGHLVTYDVLSDVVVGDVRIHGTLRFSRIVSTRLRTNDMIVVNAGGFLDMGTPADFVPRNIRAEVIWVLNQAQADAYVGGPFNLTDKGLWVLPNGRWGVHGAPLVRTWSKLAQDANAGVTDVVVENDVTDWYIGGTVVFSSTRVPKEYSIRSDGKEISSLSVENELKTIQDLAKLIDGKTKITLSQPLQFKHDGVSPFQGEVALLTRNILFKTELSGTSEALQQSDVRERKFAHTRFEPSSRGNLQYAEFKYMGHYGKAGRYATHHHQMLDSSQGMIIRGISGWYNGFRCVNIHITHGVLVEDNVCFNSQSTAFFVEQDDSLGFNEDNVFVHNLAIGTRAKHFDDRNNRSVPGEARRVASFWPGAKTVHEAFLGNVAAGGGDGIQVSTGFHFPESGNSPGSQGTIPSTFVANEVHSNADDGIFTWQNSVPSRDMVGAILWRNGNVGISWGAYGSPLKYFNTELLENGKAGLNIISVNSFLQDSVITGTTVDNSTSDAGYHIGGYVQAQWPGRPVWIVRNTFRDLLTSGFDAIEGNCVDSFELQITERPVLVRECSGLYVVQMGNSFQNVGRNLSFGMQANPNSWVNVFDYTDSDTLPNDFVMVRKDLLDPAKQGVITEKLVNAQTFYSAEVDALVTPMSSLPTQIEFTGLLNSRSLADQSKAPSPDFTFATTPDYPPQITLDVTLNGKVATLKATATDDNQVTSVEFFVDWINIATLTTPITGNTYETTIDLSDHPRKYAYLYARAFDGKAQLGSYQQRAYSDVVEIGPEVILQGQALPPPAPPVNQAPVVHAGADATITLASPATLIGTASNDGLPNPPGAVTTTWTQVSGPATVTFSDASALNTTASFSLEGLYVLRLTANDGELSASDDVTITVTPQPVLSIIAISPASAMVQPGGILQFAATGLDQISDPIIITGQIQWSVGGGQTIDQTGLFNAGPSAGGPFTVTATVGAVSGTATVTVSASSRATNGLVALYDFSTGSGNTVRDISGVGTPLDLNIMDTNRITWLPGTNGVEFVSGGSAIKSPSAATKIHSALSATNRLTLEAWITPANLTQGGPARIVTTSDGTSTSQVNLHLGQSGSGGDFRLRTTGNAFSWLNVPGVFPNATTSRHVVITYDGAAQRMFVDGLLQGTTKALSGDFANWDASYQLVLGNEATLNRSWQGKIFLVAIYDRVLTGQEIQQNFEAGSEGTTPPSINQAPVVSAAADSTVTMASTATASLSGTVSDDGLPNPPGLVTTNWSQVSGPGTVSFGNASVLATTATFTVEGTYVLRLTASDGALSASDDVTITVNPAPPVNQPPVINAGAAAAVTMASVATASLSGTVSDDGLPNPPGLVTTNWSQVSGPGTVSFGNASALATTATFTVEGTYVLRLAANDGEFSTTDDLTVTVAPPVFGDASLGGSFGIEDLHLVIDWLVGRVAMPAKSDAAYVAADVDGDGGINLADLHWMIIRLAGRVSKFPVEP